MNLKNIVYYLINMILLVLGGWIYSQINPIFPIEKLIFIFVFVGLIHQGLYYYLSKKNHAQTLWLTLLYGIAVIVLIAVCSKSIPHYLIAYEYDNLYKLIGLFMFISAIPLFCRVLREKDSVSVNALNLIKQIAVGVCVFLVSYICTFGITDKSFDIERAEGYVAVQEEAGFEDQGTTADMGDRKFDIGDEEIKTVGEVDGQGVALTKSGKVFLSEAEGWIAADDVESWENVAFISCGKTHMLGLTFDGKVLSAGEGFYGQTDVNVMDNVEYIYAGNEKSYLITTEGDLIVIGADCNGEDYEKLQTLYNLAKK